MIQYGLVLPNGGVDPRTMAEFAAVAEAGMTWWIEYVPPADLNDMRTSIERGPLR